MANIETLQSTQIDTRILTVAGPVALDFYQKSCAPCRVLEPRLERVAQEYEDRMSVYRVDVDEELRVAEQFSVMSLPTVLVFKNGQEIERLDGLIREEDLKRAFNSVLA